MVVPNTMMMNENLFKLQCLIKTTEIQQSIQCNFGRRLFLALTTSNAEIVLYFKKDLSCLPVIKRIPWFQGPHKQIASFCFDPTGIWLLCITLDGSLYILPALTLVGENYVTDKRWKTDDATYIPFVNLQLSHFRPTAITWWKDTKMSIDIGIIGTECGAIILFNLLNGQQLGTTYVNGSISSLHICQNENNEAAFVLITSKFQQQWRLSLKQHLYNLLHNLENKELHSSVNSNGTIYNNTEDSSVPNKSKLQELKQLSVEKLAIFKQKLIDTKNQTLGESSQCHDAPNKKEIYNGLAVNSEISESKTNFINPEPISKDTFLTSQYDREGQQLYTCYHPSTHHITVHSSNMAAVPLSMHKVFESCETVLLTHRFFFITDINQYVIYIISDQLSETHINKDYRFNSESIIGTFSFKSNKEVIRAVYKVTNFDNVIQRKVSQEVENKCTLPKNIKDIKIEVPKLDTCIIVTNRCVYEVILRKSLFSIFMELVLKKNELQKAGKLAMIFGLNGQQLLEYAGDIFLSNKEFPRAVASYKMSRCKLLKSVLKFASIGHTSELLSCLTHCLLTPVITEMPTATRIHLSNLCILAFIEMTLRVWSEQSKAIYKEFLYFLSTNMFYDELLAINIAGQTYLWEVLHHLATQRSLYGQMLDILMKTVQMFGTNNVRPKSYGLLICLSESDLIQAMLLNHDLARAHMLFVRSNLRESQIFVLQRLVTLYDPTNPVLRPKLLQYITRHKTSYNLRSSQCDFTDITDNIDQLDTLVGDIVETFILILLTLIHKKQLLNSNYKSTFLYDVQLPEINKEYSEIALHVDFKRRSLSAGFSHVALIRNGNIYTWGSSVQGCLGTGSSVLRYGAPHAICFFRSMEVEVFSVSCGHCHTLAVTNNGIYAWGSSQFGQLGLGKVLQCSSPELIISLAQEIIIDAVAGQYHSVALTADGRVFTWGWGIHGQLGHGNTDEKITPSLVTALLGVVVRCISAGYAHTLALSVDGIVYAFGSNVLGQLGIGGNAKSSIPTKISLPDGIILINTGYFHNLALSDTNKLYVWGASPQVLRLQAQAQKRTRILEQQDERKNKTLEESEKMPSGVINLNEDLLEDSVQTVETERITSSVETRKKPSGSANLRNIELIDESQAHLKPSIVDTSLIRGQITQISAGCHHNALITKDGSLYTWGRNLDGQLGNGTRKEVPIPTPLSYNPACILAQIPPRHTDFKKTQNQRDSDNGAKSNDLSTNNKNAHENNGNVTGVSKSENIDHNNKERSNPIINTVGIVCGYDYTVAIQPGGTVLAWGNNNRAQLGRIPAKETRDTDDKLVLLKSSKRVVRLPNTLHVALDVPSQVPGISIPVISYQSNDATCFTGLIRPLSVIEKSPGELTLHYVLEQFYSLYHSANIMDKCIELENYQACSKIAALEGDILTAFTYQLKALHKLSIRSSISHSMSETIPRESTAKIISQNADATKDTASCRSIKKNTELFNRQAEKNLMESLENSVTRSWTKISTSRSLNNLQAIAQEFYTFDCQGGLEELCITRRKEEESPSNENQISDIESSPNRDEQCEWIEHLFDKNDSLSHKNIAHDTMPEYIKIFSSLMADNYGAPLNGYPGTSRNNSSQQMMEGIISTVSSEMEDSKLFAHIKDSDAVDRLLTMEEDNMIFTCGHHFPISVYETDVIPTMETELLTSPSLVLPCTSQYLGNMLSHTSKPEILCPSCIVGALKLTAEKSYE
ncbi:X-linked retinitis pigmentosa GTPase regulator-like protein [Camponotus floridanus]|uniref:X-linked retinitis pigmentosa GTPase regulator-like protein n=1 Tax=Camponotus floridanus TaxID=104421 RepID=E2AJV8_CAMFO|nr:X-linked retinitis pigmentosa GTPase regulator-like protein [Camponotus floridanus]